MKIFESNSEFKEKKYAFCSLIFENEKKREDSDAEEAV